MAEVTLHGNAMPTAGDLPAVGSQAPDFLLTAGDLSDKRLADYSARKKVLNIFPSVDTDVCALSVKKFNDYAAEHGDTVMLQVSADLPFAQGRFCGDNNLENVDTLSMLRDKSFAQDYGTLLTDGPFAGLSARAVVVLDADNKVLHSELVPEIGNEPDYQAALNALK